MATARRIAHATVAFDLVGIDIRNLRMDGLDVVDHVYVSVRDRNWDTIRPEVVGLEQSVAGDELVIDFEAVNVAGNLRYSWSGRILVTADGLVSYEMRGRADSDFAYCRIGFCLLYPERTYRGRNYRVDTSTGRYAGVLPDLIAAQSIVDGIEQSLFPACSALELDLPGGTVRADFEGDLFEMEDQRNWTDASFKLYCTPIALGYPHHADRGREYFQRITIATNVTQRADVARPPAIASDAAPVVIDLGTLRAANALDIGLGTTSELDRTLDAREIGLIRQLRPDHLRVDLHPEAPGWHQALQRAVQDARATGTSLLVALHTGPEVVPQVGALAASVQGRDVSRILVLDAANCGTATTSADRVRRVRAALAEVTLRAEVGGGTDGDFAELNRDRPQSTGLDFVTYAVNPQVHVSDEISMAGTLPTQALTVRTAAEFSEGVPIVVGPVTLRPRFNPAATGPADPLVDGELPATVDPRQSSIFAAAWTLGSIAALAGAGADAATYYETVGWRGVVERSDPRSLSMSFPSVTGTVFPMFHVLRDLADRVEDANPGGGTEGTRADGWVASAEAGSGWAAVGFPAQHGRVLLVANLTNQDLVMRVGPFVADVVRTRVLDNTNADHAAHNPNEFRSAGVTLTVSGGQVELKLTPWASARLDVP